MDVPESLVSGKKVLLVWHGGHSPEAIQPVVERLREKAAESGGSVMLEHAERLAIGSLIRGYT